MQRYSEAESFFLEALAMTRRIFSESHPDTISCLNSLAQFYFTQMRYEDAEPFFVDALTLTKRLYGFEHPEVVRYLNNLASIYGKQGNFSDAISLFQEASTLSEKINGLEALITQDVRSNLQKLQNQLNLANPTT